MGVRERRGFLPRAQGLNADVHSRGHRGWWVVRMQSLEVLAAEQTSSPGWVALVRTLLIHTFMHLEVFMLACSVPCPVLGASGMGIAKLDKVSGFSQPPCSRKIRQVNKQ